MIANYSFPIRGPLGFANLLTRLKWLHAKLNWRHIRGMIAAALIILSKNSIVYADERFQDWIPDVIVIPQDAKVVTDRAIGSTVRMFSILTGANVETLFADWEESLSSNGYLITQNDGELQKWSIEFSGPGIANAKIILAPVTENNDHLIEFDATLN